MRDVERRDGSVALLGENELDDWLLAIVDPLGGDVDEWVFGRHPRRPAA